MEKRKSKVIKTKTVIAKNKSKDFEVGSDNIFADLGLANPEVELAKAELAIQIYLIIKQKKLTQAKAAILLGIDQAKVSALMTGKLAGFSMERLFKFLNELDQNVAIKIKPKIKAQKKGSTIVSSYNKASSEASNDSLRSNISRNAMYAKK